MTWRNFLEEDFPVSFIWNCFCRNFTCLVLQNGSWAVKFEQVQMQNTTNVTFRVARLLRCSIYINIYIYIYNPTRSRCWDCCIWKFERVKVMNASNAGIKYFKKKRKYKKHEQPKQNFKIHNLKNQHFKIPDIQNFKISKFKFANAQIARPGFHFEVPKNIKLRQTKSIWKIWGNPLP